MKYPLFPRRGCAILPALLCSVLMTLPACEKEEAREPLRKIHAIVYQNGPAVREYDAQGRISRITQGNSGYNTYYTYGSREITTTYTTPNNESTIEKLALNNAGYVAEWYNKYGELKYSRDYDAGGYLVRQHFYSNGAKYQTYKYDYVDGDLKSITIAAAAGNPTGTITYEYYDAENTLTNERLGTPYLGGSNKHLVKTYLYSSITNTTNRIDYTYEFDEAGLVTSERRLQNNNGQVSSELLEYQYE